MLGRRATCTTNLPVLGATGDFASDIMIEVIRGVPSPTAAITGDSPQTSNIPISETLDASGCTDNDLNFGTTRTLSDDPFVPVGRSTGGASRHGRVGT